MNTFLLTEKASFNDKILKSTKVQLIFVTLPKTIGWAGNFDLDGKAVFLIPTYVN